jgi:predicted ABC-type ATPase
MADEFFTQFDDNSVATAEAGFSPIGERIGVEATATGEAELADLTEDNRITNRLVDQGKLPEAQRETIPQDDFFSQFEEVSDEDFFSQFDDTVSSVTDNRPVLEQKGILSSVLGGAKEAASDLLGLTPLSAIKDIATLPERVTGAKEAVTGAVGRIKERAGRGIESAKGITDPLSGKFTPQAPLGLLGAAGEAISIPAQAAFGALSPETEALVSKVSENLPEGTTEKASEILDLLPDEIKNIYSDAFASLGLFGAKPTLQGAKSGAIKAEKTLNASIEANRLNKLAKVTKQQEKFTTEILQTPIAELKATEIGISPRGVKEASKIIKKAESFEEVSKQLTNVADESISKVNAKISRNADLPTNTDEILDPLRRRVAELERDPGKANIAKRYRSILDAEEARIDKLGGTQNLGEAQAKKIGLNDDLSTFFSRKKDPTDLEIADTQGRNLLREGYMKQIEAVAGKDVGEMNRVFAGLSDAKAWLNAVDARFARDITPTLLQRIATKVPIVKGLLKGSPDTVIGTRSANLLDILPQRTKDIQNLRKEATILKKKLDFKKGATPKTTLKKDLNLSKVDSAIQDKTIAKYESNPKKLVDDYIAKFGKKVNTDDARNLFKNEGYNGANSASVHSASSAVAKDVWRHQLKTNTEPIARLMAGGSGAGKSSVARALGVDTKNLSNIASVLDGNLSKLDSALDRIKEAKKAGKEVEIQYVYREPVDSFENGVLSRMIDSSDPLEKGRVVPIDIHVKNHTGALDVAKKLLKRGEDITIIDNSLGFGNSAIMGEKKLLSLKMPKDFETQLRKITQQYLNDGKITQEQFNALMR